MTVEELRLKLAAARRAGDVVEQQRLRALLDSVQRKAMKETRVAPTSKDER